MNYGFLFSSRWLKYIALALIAATACVFLALWQKDRREQRVAEINRIERNYDGELKNFSQLVPDAGSSLAAADEWSRVQLTGRYDAAGTVLARNRAVNNEVGYYVVVPFDLTTGGRIALVRGFVPTTSNDAAPTPDAVPAPPAGQTTVTAWLRPAEDGAKDNNPAGLIKAIDPQRIPAIHGDSAGYSQVYGQVQTEEPGPVTAITALPAPDRSEGSHLSYMFQWIAFGIMILVAVAWGARKERQAADEVRAQQGATAAEAGVREYVVVDKDALLVRGKAARSTGRYGDRVPQGTTGQAARPSTPQKRSAEQDEDAFLDSLGY